MLWCIRRLSAGRWVYRFGSRDGAWEMKGARNVRRFMDART